MKDKTSESPKIRFKGFTDAWEQRELADVVDIRSGRDYKHLSNGDIPVYGTGGYMLSVNEALSYYDDAIGIGRKGTIDKPYILNAPFWTVDTLFYAVSKEKHDLSFLYDVFQKIDWKKKDESTGVPSLSKTTINTIEVNVPTFQEQKIIGNFFANLDNLITLHQRKLELLKETKKGMLQKLFPKVGFNVPEIRFAGFADAWEQRKLSELLFPADERNNLGKYTQDDVLAASLGTDLVKKHIFFGLRSTEESVKNYRVVNSGDVIYTKSPIKGFPNGIIRTNKGLAGIVPSLYCVYHSIPSINSSIIQSYFEDIGRLDIYLYPLVNIGARNNVNITDFGFLEGTICIPQDIDEQNKIVAFLNHLTNLITLHQRELDLLKDLKKSMLQQMFI